MSNRVKYTVVCPALNEAENLAQLVSRIAEVLDPLDVSYEVMIVDDGSTDDSHARLERIGETTTNLTVVALEQNFGQTPALQAGFDHALGERVITIDADLQMDPADIPRMIEKLESEELDVVYLKKHYEDAPLIRTISSKVANWARRIITQDKAADVGCNYKVYRANFFKGRNFASGLHRFFTGFAEVEGLSIGFVEGPVKPRPYGETKYTVWGRLKQGIGDMFYYSLYRSRRSGVPRLFFALLGVAILAATLPIPAWLRTGLLLADAAVFATLMALLAHAVHVAIQRQRRPYRIKWIRSGLREATATETLEPAVPEIVTVHVGHAVHAE